MPEGNPLVAPVRDDRTAVTGIAESAVSLAHGVFNGDRVEAGLGGIGVGLAPREWVDRQFYAIVTDLVGTPTELVDADGALAWRARSGLWGRVLAPPDDATGCPLRFPGHDPETGHNYNHYRHYDPETARYTSADPVGLTPYRLSDTNPIPRRIRDQYEVIRLGNGTPRIDPETGQQTVSRAGVCHPGSARNGRDHSNGTCPARTIESCSVQTVIWDTSWITTTTARSCSLPRGTKKAASYRGDLAGLADEAGVDRDRHP